MTPGPDDLRNSVEEMWAGLVGSDLAADATPNAADPPGRYLSACCQITGGWTGAFTIDMPYDLAVAVTATMFGSEPDGVIAEEVNDAIGELANVAGGMLKGLLAVDCALGLPTMFEGTGFVVRIPGAVVGSETAWTCDGHRVLARLHVPQAAIGIAADAA